MNEEEIVICIKDIHYAAFVRRNANETYDSTRGVRLSGKYDGITLKKLRIYRAKRIISLIKHKFIIWRIYTGYVDLNNQPITYDISDNDFDKHFKVIDQSKTENVKRNI